MEKIRNDFDPRRSMADRSQQLRAPSDGSVDRRRGERCCRCPKTVLRARTGLVDSVPSSADDGIRERSISGGSISIIPATAVGVLSERFIILEESGGFMRRSGRGRGRKLSETFFENNYARK